MASLVARTNANAIASKETANVWIFGARMNPILRMKMISKISRMLAAYRHRLSAERAVPWNRLG